MLNRRSFLSATAGFAVAGLASPLSAGASDLSGIKLAAMRGSINAGELGLRPAAFDDQSKAFAKMLDEAANRDMPVFLPPGVYIMSNLSLPPHVRLSGVPGATRIIYGGDGHLMLAEEAVHIELSGLVLDGANRWIGDQAQGLLDLRRIGHLVVENCQIIGSSKNGVALERVTGRIDRSNISGAADAGIYSVEAVRLDITGNSVSDWGSQWRHGSIRQRHQHFPRKRREGRKQFRFGLRFLGDPRQQFEQSADRRQQLLAQRRNGALRRIRVRGCSYQRQHRRRRG
jgi:uncharacterized secreted repeat protein (TIGR03808 family)